MADLFNLKSAESREPTQEEIEDRKKLSSAGLELLQKNSPLTYAFYQRYDSVAKNPDFKDKPVTVYAAFREKTTITTKGSEIENQVENINTFKVRTEDVFGFWFKPDPKNILEKVKSLNVAIHESYHIYTLILKKKPGFHTYHFLSDEDVIIHDKEVFPSDEIKPLIPSEFQNYRFYLDQGPERGIFYLINEWHAYYYGLKAEYDLRENFTNTNENTWINYIGDFQSNMNAYYAFRLFIVQYFNHARTEYPEMYESLRSDNELIRLLEKIDHDYRLLFEEFYAFRKDLLERAKEHGYTMYRKEGRMVFKHTTSTTNSKTIKSETGADSVTQVTVTKKVNNTTVDDIKDISEKYDAEFPRLLIQEESFRSLLK